MQPWYDSSDLNTRFYKQIPKVEVLVRGIKPTFKRWKKDGQAFALDGDGNRDSRDGNRVDGQSDRPALLV